MAKAANIVRKQLFERETFNGDLSFERMMSSVPLLLFQLIELILGDETSTTEHCKGIAANISQLIKFNTVSTKRSYKKSKKEYTRHSLAQEPPLPVAIGLFIWIGTP